MEIYINGNNLNDIKSELERNKAVTDILNDFITTIQIPVADPDSITGHTNSEISMNLKF